MYRVNGINYMPQIKREGETGGAPGGGTAQETPPNSQDTENNGEDNVDDFGSLWQPNTAKPENDPNANPQDKTANAGESFQNYIESLNMGQGVDMQAIASGIETGDYAPLQNAMAGVAQEAYKNAVLDTSRIVDQKVAAAVKEAVKASQGSYKADQAVRAMTETLPFTADPAVQPVAKAVMSQLVSQGKSEAEAIDGVKRFFQHTMKLSAKDLGMGAAPNSRGSNSFGQGGIPSQQAESDPTDWMEILTKG